MTSLMSNNKPLMKLSDEIWNVVDTIIKRFNKLSKVIYGKYGDHEDYNIAPSQTLELEGFKRKLERFLNMTDSKERDISVSILHYLH